MQIYKYICQIYKLRSNSICQIWNALKNISSFSFMSVHARSRARHKKPNYFFANTLNFNTTQICTHGNAYKSVNVFSLMLIPRKFA